MSFECAATVQHHLTSLRSKGFLDHDGAAHGLRLAPLPVLPASSRVQDDLRSFDGGGGGSNGRRPKSEAKWDVNVPGMQVIVPLLGTISAGKPLEATEESDEYVPIPTREIDKPFLMPIEDIFSIEGRGTVITGRIERGIVKVGDEVEIVGLQPTTKTTVTGIEMFNKQLQEGQAGWAPFFGGSPRFLQAGLRSPGGGRAG